MNKISKLTLIVGLATIMDVHDVVITITEFNVYDKGVILGLHAKTIKYFKLIKYVH